MWLFCFVWFIWCFAPLGADGLLVIFRGFVLVFSPVEYHVFLWFLDGFGPWSTSLRTSWADVATAVGCPQCCCWMLATVLMFCCSVVLEISSLSRYLLVGTWSERFGIYMGIFHVFFWLHGADVTVWTQWAGASFGGARRSLTFGATLSRDLESFRYLLVGTCH